MRSLSVFVSSTCYDLRQIRADLREFLERSGFDAVLSESNGFPITPDASILDNCLRAVEQRADIFVLIIGGRYGSVTEQGKSITNLEFLRAKAADIPVYIFVERRVLAALPLWITNPNGDFTSVVDTPKVFEFMSSIRDSGNHWVFAFDTAQDICDTLRTQFSYLFREALELQCRVYGRSTVVPASLAHVRGDLMRLLIERPRAWEYLFFARALEDELEKCSDLRLDWQHDVAFGDELHLSASALGDWTQAKLSEATRLWSSAVRLMDTALQDAFGPRGVPGDAEKIYYVAVRIASVYREILKWKLDFVRVSVAPELQKLKTLNSELCDNTVYELEAYARSLRPSIINALNQAQRTELPLILKLTAPDTAALVYESARVRSLINADLLNPNA